VSSDKVTMSEDDTGRGEPDLRIAGLKIWIHSRSHPEEMSYWDGNWLTITAVCSYQDSYVRTTGSIIHLREMKRLLLTCENLDGQTHGEAGLHCMEPELNVELIARPRRPIAVKISITPEYRTQQHVFLDKISRRDLRAIKLSCRRILEKHDIRSDNTEREPIILNV